MRRRAVVLQGDRFRVMAPLLTLAIRALPRKSILLLLYKISFLLLYSCSIAGGVRA